MKLSDFDYDLPQRLIAQTPLKDRSASRLLVLDPKEKSVKHQQFNQLKNFLKEGDCLVLNDTRVLPARLFGKKMDTGANIEMLLLHPNENDVWETLVKPARKVKIGTTLIFGHGQLEATCIEKKEHGGCLFELKYEGILNERLEEIGQMPLPPYIKKRLNDQQRYQTVFAREQGSAAAPTAGLHFTEDLLDDIEQMGVDIAYITLHVGLGTFRPVATDEIEKHQMHAEYYHMSEQTADLLNHKKQNGGRIIAVGTTTTRTLETIVQQHGSFKSTSGWTDIFIYPPYKFKSIDGLITNFHLPKSTLLMLVSAFAGLDNIRLAYQEAIKEQYRFFSFGDAMLILSS